MSGPAGMAILAGVVVDAGLKATVPLALAWGATRILPWTSAAQRHALWTVALGSLPVLGVLAAQRGGNVALDTPWLVVGWLAGVVFALLPVLRGLVVLERLRRTATPDPLRKGLLHSDAVDGPITWGLFRPVVVLPRSSAGWSTVDRAAALAHEDAHIARRDWGLHLAAELVTALFWFHPLVWLARRELGREAEHAADDHVLGQGFLPSDYASLLVRLATAKKPARTALGAASSLVGRRVLALLEGRSRSARRWPLWIAALALGAAGLPLLGAWPTWQPASDLVLTCQPGPSQ